MSGDTIGDFFPHDEIEARFVVVMAMAKNDIERAVRDALRANKHNFPGFDYRVRLMIGHLIEAIRALKSYEREPPVKRLVAQLPDEAKQQLKVARATQQKVGGKALDHARHHTFHYPSPASTSDETLSRALHGNRHERLNIRIDEDVRLVTFTFADALGFAVAIGKHRADHDELKRQFERTQTGAIAFVQWARTLVYTYLDQRGADIAQLRQAEG